MTRDGETGFGGAALTLAPDPAPAPPAADGARPPLSLTRAAHGYPGGIEDAAAAGDDLLAGEETEQQPHAAADDKPGVPVGVARAAVWQSSLAAWQDAGIDWQPKAAAPASADRDWSTEPIPVITLQEQSPPEAAPSTPAEPADVAAEPAAVAAEPAAVTAEPAAVATAPAAVATAPAAPDKASAAPDVDVAAVPAEIDPTEIQPGELQPGELQPGELQPGELQPGETRASAGDRAGRPSMDARRKRRRLMAAAVGTSVVVAVGVVVGVAVSRSPGAAPAPAFGPAGPYPPARTADADFAGLPAGSLGSVWTSLTDVTAAGNTVVAVGSQPGLPAARPVILVSSDGGHTWRRASLALPGSAGPGSAGPGSAELAPAPVGPGAGPSAGSLLVAGGDGRWLALGDRAGWVSADGTNWRPVTGPPGTGSPGAGSPDAGLPGTGLPGAGAGDRVAALARTSGGFLAVGENARLAAGHQVSTPVIWFSPDGITWRRSGAPELAPGAGGGRVLGLYQVAAHGQVILIAGQIARDQAVRHGGRRVNASVTAPALWRSEDGGATWQPVKLPAGRGADGGLAGIAATSSTFVAVRTGHNLRQRRDAVVYVSAGGAAWHTAARLIAGGRAALWSTAVAGGENGVAVTAVIQGHRAAFVSNGAGTRWHRTGDLGGAYARPFTGVTVAPDGSLIAAGMDGRRTFLPDNPRPFLLLARNRPQQVGNAVLVGTGAPDVIINGLASAPGQQLAVGSANGAPAVWVTAVRAAGAAGTGAAGAGTAGAGTAGAGTAGAGASGTGAAPAGSPGAGADQAWTRAAMSLPRSWNGGGAGLTSAAHGPAGWFAVGSRSGFGRPAAASGAVPGASGQATARPVVMTSRNGLRWHAAPDAGPLLAPGVTLAQVAAGPNGYVVVGGKLAASTQQGSTQQGSTQNGSTQNGSTQNGSTQQAAAWFSSGLTGWVSARDAGQGDLDGPSPRQMLAVTAAGTGFVAAGYAGSAPAVWVSQDGSTWRLSALPVPTGAVSAALTAVTASGHRLAATGTATTRSGTEAFAATSVNSGRTWHETLLPLPRLAEPGGAGAAPAGQTPAGQGQAGQGQGAPSGPGGSRIPFSVTALTAAGGGFVATGVADTPAGQDVLVWSSRDGLTWRGAAPTAGLLHGPGAREIDSLAAAGHWLTAIGYESTTAGQHPIRWQPRLH